MGLRAAWSALWEKESDGLGHMVAFGDDADFGEGDLDDADLERAEQAAQSVTELTGSMRVGDFLGMNTRQFLESLGGSVNPNFPNPDAGTEHDDRFFLALERGAPLDLPPQMQQTAQRLSLILYRKNVRATRAINLVTDFAWGDGPSFLAADAQVQELLSLHWLVNQWSRKGPERSRALGIFGEQLYPVFVDEKTGLVRVSSVSPFRIKRINRDPQDAENFISATTTLGIVDHHGASDDDGKAFALMLPAQPSPEAIAHHAQHLRQHNFRLVGEAFYFGVNRIAGASRGLPDLLSAIDWLEGLDQFVFGLLERANISQNIVWDIEYEGLRDKEIKKKLAEFVRALRKNGGVYGHNEKTKLSIKVPVLGSSDAETTVKIMLRQIQSGTGLAGLFYGDNADLTRASASELSVPVAKMIQGRQNFLKGMLTEIFAFQIEAAVEAGTLPEDVDRSFEVNFPRIFLRDIETISKALVQTSTALATAVDEGWLSKMEARNLFRGAVEQLGPVGGPTLTLPSQEEVERDANEASENELEDIVQKSGDVRSVPGEEEDSADE